MPDTQSSRSSDPRSLPISFTSFLVSLGSSALVHLGEIADPATGKPNPNHELARQTIDVLGILRDKTQGNLDEEESKLMEALLYDLRTKFLASGSDIEDG
ncbi:MAG: DUF1844 domain-containing protein [Myxococcota bacterium]|jgi:hypothetical protein|nr:DUF1844 domain-containing protein [Myxococcota bacterium]